eukprot:TRINITY_DN35652_c0_g1_i3.p1 TRINITY_DN35652_c0_g1~~TRINITY_DN35652_c0_g1_i3.p1  ORF type:complete len:215 (+),score=16.96 TRINITY_DN35652_c0_g1_i3:64-708(+)
MGATESSDSSVCASPTTRSQWSSEGSFSSGADGCCDRCDGSHPTDACPHFKRPRGGHKDAWVMYGKRKRGNLGSDGGDFVLRHARVVQQPGDGSCLFHSLCYGLSGRNASNLRRELAQFIAENPALEIAGDTLQEWVRWDAGASIGSYANRMASGGWGGGIEMAVCSHLKGVNVHVYEEQRAGFKRISCFNVPRARKTIHVLYRGRNHFDALAV